jgi:hypothetical protein
VVAWCRREMPEVHVLYNAQHGADMAVDGAGARKGLIGAPGWDEDDPDKPQGLTPKTRVDAQELRAATSGAGLEEA